MTQLSLWLEAQALLQDIVGWGHPRAGSLQATLNLSFKSWANLFGDFHLGVGVKRWTIPLLIFCLCDHTLLVVGVFMYSVLGRASLDCAGWENSTCTTWAHFPFMDWTIQDWLWDTLDSFSFRSQANLEVSIWHWKWNFRATTCLIFCWWKHICCC